MLKERRKRGKDEWMERWRESNGEERYNEDKEKE
jgi:hypothetical protein